MDQCKNLSLDNEEGGMIYMKFLKGCYVLHGKDV